MTNRAKLTKGYVDRVKPGSKDELHWDTEVKGFGLRVATGGKLTSSSKAESTGPAKKRG